MHESGPRSPARLLAPLALVVFALAVALVVLSSSVGRRGRTAARTPPPTGPAPRRRPPPPTTTTTTPQRATYTVKTGDTLGLIAEKTGVPVERLQELNPELDPQALLSGQKINLRE